jgi:menaquinone-dependent protoporphyrinogen oxidase
MTTTLIIYSTTDGHTIRICTVLKQVLEAHGQQAVLMSVGDLGSTDLRVFDKIVIGASIRYGRHSRLIADFIERNAQVLDSKANAFFSVNIVARKPDKCEPHTNPYLRKFLKRIAWQPKHLAVFAGRLDYPKYRFFDRLMIRFIMWLTKGPTDPTTVIEYTDWQAVRSFGRTISDM